MWLAIASGYLCAIDRGASRALAVEAPDADRSVCWSHYSEGLRAAGRQRLVRHGHLPEREIMTGIGPGRRALPARAGPRRRRLRAHPLFVGNSAAIRTPVEEPRGADPDPLQYSGR